MNTISPRTIPTRTTITAFFLLAFALTGCDTVDSSEENRQLLGDAKTLGAGTVRAFVDTDADEKPLAYGLILSEAALANPGGDHADKAAGPRHEGSSTVLRLPEGAREIPVDHIAVDWNPNGHEPPGLYDVPHFDFHFYLMTEAERALISPDDPAFDAKGAKPLAPQHVPAGYIQTPGVVPLMGSHWVDANAPEMQGQPFTSTFIFGSYDGVMNFLEPMTTKAYFESVKALPGQSVSFPIPQPQAYGQAGYYPTRYSITYRAATQEYVVSFDGLVRH